MKDNETDEQRSERLGKLREQFPWALRENPSDVVKLWTKREGKDGQKLTQQQQRELLGFGGEGPAANDYDSASSDEGGTGGSKRRRRQHHDEGEAGGSDGCDDRDVKKMRGPDDDGVCRDASGGPQGEGGGGGGTAYGHLDAEDRIGMESVDDWRIGRQLIKLMGWCAEDDKGLGLHGQGRRRAVEVRGRMGKRGLGSGSEIGVAGAPARAGIPKNWPSGTPNDRFAPSGTYQH